MTIPPFKGGQGRSDEEIESAPAAVLAAWTVAVLCWVASVLIGRACGWTV